MPTTDPPRKPEPAPLHPGSLCHRCAERRYVTGRSTLFVRCNALPTKYPPQPVRTCVAFRARPAT